MSDQGKSTTLPTDSKSAFLANQYKLGQPVAMYNTAQSQVRYLRLIVNIALFVASISFALSLFLFVFANTLTFWQPWFSSNQHLSNIEFTKLSKIYLLLPCLLSGALACAFYYVKHLFTQKFAISYLVCTEGILKISSKEVEAIFWHEVTDIIQVSKGRYTLNRNKRQILFLNVDSREIDSAVNLISQYIQNR